MLHSSTAKHQLFGSKKIKSKGREPFTKYTYVKLYLSSTNSKIHYIFNLIFWHVTVQMSLDVNYTDHINSLIITMSRHFWHATNETVLKKHIIKNWLWLSFESSNPRINFFSDDDRITLINEGRIHSKFKKVVKFEDFCLDFCWQWYESGPPTYPQL